MWNKSKLKNHKGMTGKSQSAETRSKIGAKNKAALAGRKLSEKHKLNISKGNTGSKNAGKFAKGHVSWLKGKKVSAATRKKLSISVSAALKQAYKDGTRKYAAPKKYKDTKIEIAIQNELTALGIAHVSQYHVKGLGYVDIYIPQWNMVIECDGCYWHGCPEHYPGKNPEKQSRDSIANTFLIDNRYTLLRLWEHQIKADAKECVAFLKP